LGAAAACPEDTGLPRSMRAGRHPGTEGGAAGGELPPGAYAGRIVIAPPAAFFRAARSSSQMVSGLAMYTLE